MFRLAVRSARTNWRRFTLTTFAVVIGVAFVTGSFVLTDSLAASIDRLLAAATGQTDFVVRSADAGAGSRAVGGAGLGGGRRGSSSTLDLALVATLESSPDVEAADPTVIGVAQLLGKAGKDAAFDVSAVSNWPAFPEMTALELLSGRAPAASDEVVIDQTTATERSLRLGSVVRIGTRRGVSEARIVGIGQRGGGNLGAAGAILAVTLPRATELVGLPAKVDSINLRLRPGVDHDAARARLAALAGPTASVLSSDTLLADARQRIQERLANFNSLMLGFASVTLFVSAFLIWNTFSIVVAQRRREIALLRAVGAGRRQVLTSVVSEGALVGAASSGLGIGAGVLLAIGLRNLLSSFGVELPSGELVVAARTIAVALLVGLGVTLVSVIGPARRATRVPPVAAMQAAATPAVRGGRAGTVVGLALVVVGLAVGVIGGVTAGDDVVSTMSRIGLGGLAVLVGVIAIGRFLTAPIVGVLGVPVRRLGVPSAIARRNAVRDPRRTAATASALMIGLVLVSSTLVLGDSVKTAFGGALRASIRSDLVVDAGGIVPFEGATIDAVAGVEGVAAAVPLTFGRARLAPDGTPATVGTTTTVAAAGSPGSAGSDGSGATGSVADDRARRFGITVGDPVALRRVVDPAFTSGGWPDGTDDVAVAAEFATEHDVVVGSTVTIRDGEVERTLRVSGIYERDELLDDAVGDPATIAGLVGVEPVARQLLVNLDSGARPSDVVEGLREATALVPNSSVLTADGYVTEQTEALDVVLGIVNLLLFFAVAVAGLGITNTMALSVVERTRELGLLRAVGMQRRQLRRMVRVEGVLVALLGGVLGVGLGVAFGSAIASALPADTAVLTFPWVRLAAVLVAAGVLGLVAAAVPARRAARLNVLDAVAID